MPLTKAEKNILLGTGCAAIVIGVYGIANTSNTGTLFWLAVALAWPNTKDTATRLMGWSLRLAFFSITLHSLLSEVL